MITEMVPLFCLKKEERRRIMYRNRWDLTTNFTCITPVRASNFFHFLKLHVCLIRRVQTARNCATVCVNAITVHGQQRFGHNNHNGTRSELGLAPFLASTILHMCCSYGFLFSSSSPRESGSTRNGIDQKRRRRKRRIRRDPLLKVNHQHRMMMRLDAI